MNPAEITMRHNSIRVNALKEMENMDKDKLLKKANDLVDEEVELIAMAKLTEALKLVRKAKRDLGRAKANLEKITEAITQEYTL